jgi:1-acyl-sn-glycerol-3-phosphate acyltransferase
MTPEPDEHAEPVGSPQPVEAPATGEPAATRRPTIAKTLPDKRIIIPEGRTRGEAWTWSMKLMYLVLYAVCNAISFTYWRARATGRHNVPATGPVILSPVHRSNLDTPLVALATRRRLRFMGKESLWKRKASAWFFSAAGGFPVDRATADRSAMNACLQVLERGEALVLFPEGTRQSGPVVTEMFDGAAWLACRAQCPIVPIGMGGTARAMGKGAKFPRPARIRLVVGEPIQPPPPTPGGRTSRRAVREMTEELRARLQELYTEAEAQATGSRRSHPA